MSRVPETPIWRKTKDSLKKVPYLVPAYRFFFRQYQFLTALSRRFTQKRAFPRSYFESLFGSTQDPWQYVGRHQQERLKLLLDQVPEGSNNVLEVGCAEGLFTYFLALKGRKVVAIDVSRNALKRAKEYCKPLSNIHFLQADMVQLPLAGKYDVIICAGVLVYLPEWNLFVRTAKSILNLISPRGYLVLENMWKRSGGAVEGRKIHDYFLRNSPLMLCNLVRNEEYGISVFRSPEA